MTPWTAAFVEQAEADLQVVRQVALQPRGQLGRSTVAMLLQMVFEKLAKAALAMNGQPPRRTHKAVQYLGALFPRRGRRDPELYAKFQSQLPLLLELEASNPAVVEAEAQTNGVEAPQLEYPWADPTAPTGVRTPEGSLPVAKRLASPRSTELNQLIMLATDLCGAIRAR
jgi:hypothetical protein